MSGRGGWDRGEGGAERADEGQTPTPFSADVALLVSNDRGAHTPLQRPEPLCGSGTRSGSRRLPRPSGPRGGPRGALTLPSSGPAGVGGGGLWGCCTLVRTKTSSLGGSLKGFVVNDKLAPGLEVSTHLPVLRHTRRWHLWSLTASHLAPGTHSDTHLPPQSPGPRAAFPHRSLLPTQQVPGYCKGCIQGHFYFRNLGERQCVQ